ncbi:Deaminated glutathione amidase [subsurface metagenome]
MNQSVLRRGVSPNRRVAIIQLNSGNNAQANLETTHGLLVEALGKNPDVIVLPEYSNYMGDIETFTEAAAERGSPWFSMLSSFAAENKLEIIAGLLIQHNGEKAASMACHFRRDGSSGLEYQKIHLFDLYIPGGESYRESSRLAAGDHLAIGEISGILSGLAICYDLRFPELFRRLALGGAKVIYVPAAFTTPTGILHWQVLLQVRAIENQVYIIAANQVGNYLKNKSSYGHSMIVDPRGKIIAEARGPENETGGQVISADVDLDELAAVRRDMPCLEHIRSDLWQEAWQSQETLDKRSWL